MSLATQAALAVKVIELVLVGAEVVVFAGVVVSVTSHSHPLFAVGIVTTPLVAEPPVPTLMVNSAVPFECVIDGEVPNPDAMVGAAKLISRMFPAAVPLAGISKPFCFFAVLSQTGAVPKVFAAVPLMFSQIMLGTKRPLEVSLIEIPHCGSGELPGGSK